MSKRVCVLGLSDLGRSPRLQNHAVSLSKQAHVVVDIVAYRGSTPLQDLSEDSNICIHNIPEMPAFVHRLPRGFGLVAKAFIQLWQILYIMLFGIQRPDYILLQVPPAIPALVLCWIACTMRGSQLVIDWHNFAFTLMALSHGERSPIVRVAASHEKFWGRKGKAHLCVTQAMQTELKQNWGIKVAVFYDMAPSSFHPCSLREKHSLFLKLEAALREPLHPHDCIAASGSVKGPEEQTLCTESVNGRIQLRQDRPALVVSSTSWTPDEDFSLLLDAAEEYEIQSREATTAGRLPKLLILVTGKGPQKAMYQQKMKGLDLRRVAFRTLWLDPEDYPLLLGSCDAGISLHTSSSGLDLPMKVVDMFGCGLPVLTAAYPCISELVQDGVNGLHFSTAKQLGQQLAQVFLGFPQPNDRLSAMRSAVTHNGGARPTWESEWQRVVLPLFSSDALEGGAGGKQQ